MTQPVLTDAEMHALICRNPFTLGLSIARLKDFIRQVEKAVVAQLIAEQEPVTEIDYFGDTCCPVFGDRLQLKRGTKLYAHPMPCVSPTSDKPDCVSENAENDKQTNYQGSLDSSNHIADMRKMVPEGWQLVPKNPTEEMLRQLSLMRRAPMQDLFTKKEQVLRYENMLAAAPKFGDKQ